MPPLGEVESWSTWSQRQQYLAQKKAAPAPAPISAPPSAPEPASYIEARQAEQPQLPGILQPIMGGLEHLGRFGAGARSALGGGDFGQGFQNPETAPTGYELNQQAGLNLPNANLNPLPFGPQFGAADIAGRVTEVATDPLSYVPGVGWAGKGAGILRSGLAATAPLAVDVARAPFAAARLATRRAPQSVEQAMAGPVPHLRSTEERLAANTQDTLGRRIPGATKLAEAFSHRAGDTDGTLQALLHSTDTAVDDVNQFTTATVAPFQSLRLRPTDAIDKVIEGTQDASTLSPQGQLALRYLPSRIQQVESLVDTTRTELARVAPELADSPAFTFERLANYFPRVRADLDQRGRPIRRQAVGGRKDAQFDRSFETREAGEAAGFQYESPMTALTEWVQDQAQKVAEMQMLIKLAESPYASVGKYSPLRTDAGLHQVPGYQGLWFDKDVVDQIGSYLKREDAFRDSTGLIGDAARMGNRIGAVRPFVASGDVSASFLQNLPTLATRPAIALAAIGQQFRAIANPRALPEFIAQHADTVSAVPGIVRGTEYFEQASDARRMLDSTFGRLGLPGRAAAAGIGGVLDASQRGWDMLTNASRIYLAEAHMPRGGLSAQEAGQLSDHLLHMTGAGQSRAQGLSPERRAIETGLLFAPGFLKSSVALVGDLMGGPIARVEAANALSRMAVGGAWMYQHLTDTLGQEAHWDPSDARFMTIEVGGNHVGFGGTYRSLMNLLGKVVKAPETIGPDYWNFTDPENENPIIRFWRGRASILGQRTMDILTGENYNGVPIDDNFGDIAKWVGTGFLPFAIAGAIQEYGKVTPEQAATSFVATGTGLRSFPEGRRDLQEQEAQARFGKKYDDLNLIEQAEIRNTEKIKALPEQQGARGERSKKIGHIFDRWTEGIETASQQVASGKITKSDFRKRVTAHSEVRNTRLDELEPDKKARQDSFTTAFDTWLEKTKQSDEFDRPDYEGADRYLDSLAPEVRQYIDQRLAAGLERLSPETKQLMQELRAARDTLRPYREIMKGQLERVGLLEEYDTATPAERAVIEKTAKWKVANRLAQAQKERLRRTNPAVEQGLQDWYGLKPIRGR